MPTHGDFLRRGLPGRVCDQLDGWLSGAVEGSRQVLGDSWLDIYLVAPIWRFALGGGLVGEPLAGVLMPSVDRVGRYFPLVIAATLDPDDAAAPVAARDPDWFDAAEATARLALEDDCDFDRFEAAVRALGRPTATGPGYDPAEVDGAGWAASVASPGALAEAMAFLLDATAAETGKRYGLWWTSGSDWVSPALAWTRGWPPARAFAAFLDGRWGLHGWRWPGGGAMAGGLGG
jgi:type VI secretion system protein ImpM